MSVFLLHGNLVSENPGLSILSISNMDNQRMILLMFLRKELLGPVLGQILSGSLLIYKSQLLFLGRELHGPVLGEPYFSLHIHKALQEVPAREAPYPMTGTHHGRI